ncbi:hypothetical protein HanIR_Chr13g0668691 [Helianthus annuus]|nr:hypothetical protein HanIR_Chr13g0668691 [Helianthus annuus]
MQLILVIYHRYIGQNIGTGIIGDIDRYITDFPHISTFLLIADISVLSLNEFLLATIVSVLQVVKG